MSAISAVQGPDPRTPNRHSLGSCTTLGQVEACRAQDSEDSPAARCPQAVQFNTTCPWSIQASVYRNTVVVTAGAHSRTGELAATSVLFLLVSPCNWNGARPPWNRRLTR